MIITFVAALLAAQPSPSIGRIRMQWLADVGCAGHIEVTATIGRSTRKAAVDLDCGE
jgi:hypothetical protein